MDSMLLLLLSITPGLYLVFRYYQKDIYKKEPWIVIWTSFFLGAATVIPAGLIETAIEIPDKESVQGLLIENFLVIALTEEILKLSAIYFFAYRNKNFDETIDGIVYGVAVSSGFATFENIFYVLQHGFTVGILRAFLSVPAHIFWGATLGYWLAKAKFQKFPIAFAILIGLSISVLTHGFFDFIITFKSAAYWFLSIIPVILLGFLVQHYVKTSLKYDLENIHKDLDPELFKEKLDEFGLATNTNSSMTYTKRLIYICLYFLGLIFFFTGAFLLFGFILLLRENKTELWSLTIAIFPMIIAGYMIYKARKMRG